MKTNSTQRRKGAKLAISSSIQDHAFKIGCGYRGGRAFAKKCGFDSKTPAYPKRLGTLCGLSVKQGGCNIETCGRNKKGAGK